MAKFMAHAASCFEKAGVLFNHSNSSRDEFFMIAREMQKEELAKKGRPLSDDEVRCIIIRASLIAYTPKDKDIQDS